MLCIFDKPRDYMTAPTCSPCLYSHSPCHTSFRKRDTTQQHLVAVPNPSSFFAPQLTAEGGWDAAQEAPCVYAAMDALASRAGSWAERQQRIRIENANQQAASQMAEPVVIARQAVDYVKQVS